MKQRWAVVAFYGHDLFTEGATLVAKVFADRQDAILALDGWVGLIAAEGDADLLAQGYWVDDVAVVPYGEIRFPTEARVSRSKVAEHLPPEYLRQRCWP